jgi:hypothetical protein
MLFREISAVYCEIHTEHTDTLHGQNVEFNIVMCKGFSVTNNNGFWI